jgi:hypothetical protein
MKNRGLQPASLCLTGCLFSPPDTEIHQKKQEIAIFQLFPVQKRKF